MVKYTHVVITIYLGLHLLFRINLCYDHHGKLLNEVCYVQALDLYHLTSVQVLSVLT